MRKKEKKGEIPLKDWQYLILIFPSFEQCIEMHPFRID